MEVETEMMDNYNTSTSCTCQRSLTCLDAVIAIIGAFLAFAIGLIVGIMNFEALTAAFTAIVIGAILLAVMLVVFIIIRFCNRTNDSCCHRRC